MHWEFVIASYLVVFGGLAVYIWTLLDRVRSAAEKIPEEKRAFLE